MNYIKSILSENLFSTEEAANLLGISKQRLSILTKENKIVPIKKTSKGMFFLLQDIKEFRKKTYTEKKLKDLVMITSRSISFYHANKYKLGKVFQVTIYCNQIDAIRDGYYEQSEEEYGYNLYRLDVPSMIIKGEKNEMWLGGCSCGYSGTGPSGSLEILSDLGIEVSNNIINQKIIEYQKQNNQWIQTIKQGKSLSDQIDSKINLKFFTKNNNLILIQDNTLLLDINFTDIIKMYQTFLPHPYSISIFQNQQDAYDRGFYFTSFEKGETIVFQLILEDRLGNQIWLPYYIDQSINPISDTNIQEILNLCGFSTKELSKIESIKNWINFHIFNKPILPIEFHK